MERHGEFSEALDADAKDLQAILGLSSRDAQVRGGEGGEGEGRIQAVLVPVVLPRCWHLRSPLQLTPLPSHYPPASPPIPSPLPPLPSHSFPPASPHPLSADTAVLLRLCR